MDLNEYINLLESKKIDSKIKKYCNLRNIKHMKILDELGIPKDKYLIVSSGAMALYGIRENQDIDISATPEYVMKLWRMTKLKFPDTLNPFKLIKNANEHSFFPTHLTLQYKEGLVEIGFMTFTDSVKNLLKECNTFKGYNFMSIEQLVDWKLAIGRKKDHKDVSLIIKFLEKTKTPILNKVKKIILNRTRR